MVEAKKAAIKVKKKRWIQIVAPKIFREMVLGESYVSELDQLVGKRIKTSLMSITGEPKKQNTVIIFRVTSIKESKALTEVIGYGIRSSLIKRLVRRGTERIDHSFVLKTSDGITIRLKTFMLTRRATKRSVLTSIKKLSTELLKNQIEKMSYNNLVNDLVSSKLQRPLSHELKKIYPLKVCEIREMGIVEIKRYGQEKEAPKKEQPKEEKKVEEKLKEEKKEEPKKEAKKEEKPKEEKKHEEKPKEGKKAEEKPIKEKSDDNAKTDN